MSIGKGLSPPDITVCRKIFQPDKMREMIHRMITSAPECNKSVTNVSFITVTLRN